MSVMSKCHVIITITLETKKNQKAGDDSVYDQKL